VSGTITVRNNNVTIRNFRLDGNGTTYPIGYESGHTGLVIEDGEVFDYDAAVVGGNFTNYTARRLNVHDGTGDGFKAMGNVTIESSYVHHLGTSPSSHADGVQENLALALKALSLEQQNEDNKNASSKIQGIVDNFSKSDAQLSTPSKLTFDDFGGSAPANTTKSAFGSNVANPKLEASPTQPAKVGSNTKSGDQLMSAANTAKHDGDLTANYDAGTATSAGSLVFQKSSIDLSTYSERARKDPQVIAALMELDSLQAKRSQLERERDELVKQRNAAVDKAAMDKATAELDRKEKEYQDNVAVISQKSKDLEKRHREIDAEVEAPKANEKRPSGER